MRQIANPKFLVIAGEVLKPSPGYELVVYERPLPQPELTFEEMQTRGIPYRNGKPAR